MTGKPQAAPPAPLRIAIKALILFALANLLFVLINPMPSLGRLSLYNTVLPGRARLPYGDNPPVDYNLSPYSLEAMLASHEISGSVPRPGEYRVLVMGDSASWGFLLRPDETLAAALNEADLRAPDGRRVQAYNLGYPIMSLTKDLLLLDLAIENQPDMIVWLVTLESFPREKQLYPPLLQHNAGRVRDLIERFDLRLDPHDARLHDPSAWENTIFGRRRDLADLVRLQLYGLLWAATGIDQSIPESYTPRMEDLPAEPSFQDFGPTELTPEDLAFDVLAAGVDRAGSIPLLIVNEPMFISRGANSDIRYNFYYPRWAYDAYREWMAEISAGEGWDYLDLWDELPASEFSDSAIHYTPAGARLLAARIGERIVSGE